MSDEIVNEQPADSPSPRPRRRATAKSDVSEGEPTAPEASAKNPRAIRAKKAPSGSEAAPVEAPSVSVAGDKAVSEPAVPTDAEPPKRRRGRPRKTAVADAAQAAAAPSGRSAAADDLSLPVVKKVVSEGDLRASIRASEAGAASRIADSLLAPARPSEDASAESERPRLPRRTTRAKISDRPSDDAAQNETPHESAGNDSALEAADRRSRRDASQKGRRPGALSSGMRSQSNGGSDSNQRNGQRKDRSDRQNNGQNRPNNQKNNRRHQRNDREIAPSVTREELAELKVAELRAKAAELGVEAAGVKKAELVELVFAASVKAEGFLEVTGILDVLSDGYGFLRTSGYLPGEGDCYVSASLIKRNHLRKGDLLVGQTRPARPNDKFAAVQKVISVNGTPLEQLGSRPRFADLTPVYPQERLIMEHGAHTYTARVIDLVAPIGKGQRGLIVSPPKAGKTTILKDIAASITANNPEVHLMCLLVDERPEEVTDMQRSIRGEVISSTFDMPAENHIACAEMVIERAKRMVELGTDVVILLDSITRLARAYNLAQPASGRVLSGGVDSTALYPPKRFLGAARNIEGGGSLTILASALVETGSKMDEVIFEEFKGTGNMELKLDRYLADRRIFPAIDAVASGTRKEELLMDQQVAPLVWAVRRILANMNNTERAMDTLIKSIKQTDTNQEFLLRTARKAQQSKGEVSSL